MGEPIKFDGCNVVMRAPEEAENVQDMHVYRTPNSCVSCWTLTAEELADINATGRIFLSVLAGGQQPPVYVGSERTCREVMIDFGPVWPTANRAPAPSSLHDVPCLINPEPESPLIHAADECFDESRRLAAHYMDALTAILLEEDAAVIHRIADRALGSHPRTREAAEG